MTELKLQDRVNTEYGRGKIQYFTYKLNPDEEYEKVVNGKEFIMDVITTGEIMDRKIIAVGVKLDNTPERFKTINPEYGGVLFFAPNAVEKITE